MSDTILQLNLGDFLSFAGIFVGFSSFLIAVFTMFLSTRAASRYNNRLERAELSSIRDNYEKQIEKLNHLLTANEGRWKEANHLLISSQGMMQESRGGDPVPYTKFLKGAGLREEDLIVDQSLVFVLTPFSERHQNDYGIIMGVCASVGLNCSRGDEKYVSGDLFTSILAQIVRARIVVANITGRNPNVFYELGISHALGKHTILVAKIDHELPFDVRSKYIVLFDSERDLREKLAIQIGKVLASGEA